MKSRESAPKPEAKEPKGLRNTAIALIAALASAGALLKERFDTPDVSTKTKQEQRLSKEELRDLRDQLDIAEKLASVLGATHEQAATPEEELAPGDFRGLIPSKEDLEHFPGAYLDKSTAEAMNLEGYSMNERVLAENLSENPELKAQFLQTLESLRIDGDSDALHAYLPDNDDFDIVITADEIDGMSRIVANLGDGPLYLTLGPDAENYSEADARNAIRREIQRSILQHLYEEKLRK